MLNFNKSPVQDVEIQLAKARASAEQAEAEEEHLAKKVALLTEFVSMSQSIFSPNSTVEVSRSEVMSEVGVAQEAVNDAVARNATELETAQLIGKVTEAENRVADSPLSKRSSMMEEGMNSITMAGLQNVRSAQQTLQAAIDRGGTEDQIASLLHKVDVATQQVQEFNTTQLNIISVERWHQELQQGMVSNAPQATLDALRAQIKSGKRQIEQDCAKHQSELQAAQAALQAAKARFEALANDVSSTDKEVS